MKLQIRVTPKGTISAARFKTFGCSVAIASSSWMTEKIIGLSLSQAEQIRSTDIAQELSLPVFKLYCSSESDSYPVVTEVNIIAQLSWRMPYGQRPRIIAASSPIVD
jgi:hypothetical protein